MWVRIPSAALMSVSFEHCVLSGRDLLDGLITRPEESHRLWCVFVCDLETSWMRRPWWDGCRKKKKNRESIRCGIIWANIPEFPSADYEILRKFRAVLAVYPPWFEEESHRRQGWYVPYNSRVSECEKEWKQNEGVSNSLIWNVDYQKQHTTKSSSDLTSNIMLHTFHTS